MEAKKLLKVHTEIIKAQEQIISNLQGVIDEQYRVIDNLIDILVICTESIDRVEKSDY